MQPPSPTTRVRANSSIGWPPSRRTRAECSAWIRGKRRVLVKRTLASRACKEVVPSNSCAPPLLHPSGHPPQPLGPLPSPQGEEGDAPALSSLVVETARRNAWL